MTIYKFDPKPMDLMTNVHQGMAKMFQILTKGQVTEKEVAQLPEHLRHLYTPDETAK